MAASIARARDLPGSRGDGAGTRDLAAVRAWVRCLVGAAVAGLLGLLCCLELCAMLPVAFGWRAEAVLSGSMVPQVRPGDLVLVAPLPASDVRPGQVIAFRDPAMPRTLVHRVAAVLPDGDFRTKGDANAEPDSDPVPRRNLIGVARLRVPDVALPLYWARTGQYGRLALAGAAAIALLAVAAAALSIQDRRAHHAGRTTGPRSYRPGGLGRLRYPRRRWRHLAARR